MAILCCNCDYTMQANQEMQSARVKANFDLKISDSTTSHFSLVLVLF